MTTLAVTGHRPPKLFGYGMREHDRLTKFARNQLISHRNRVGDLRIITGMALGWDQAIAQACLLERIPYIAAVPFPGQPNLWPEESKTLYKNLLHHAARIEIVSAMYNRFGMQRRNMWMVDHANEILALCDGSPGGTSNCVQYARQLRRPVWDCWDAFTQFKNGSPH